MHVESIVDAEEWRAVVDWPNYFVNNSGVLASNFRGKWRVLKPSLIKGYYNYGISKGGRMKTVRAHRLVLEAFRGPCPEGHEGCHNDGNPLNNHIDNLRWDTRKGNAADRLVHGTISRGDSSGMSKLSEADIPGIRLAYRSGVHLAVLAERYGVHKATIQKVCLRGTWAHVEDDHPEGPRPYACGSMASNAKLTEADIPEIRRSVASGESRRSVSRRYGVTLPTILNIVNGITWRHVP